jgi:hypothetical protein
MLKSGNGVGPPISRKRSAPLNPTMIGMTMGNSGRALADRTSDRAAEFAESSCAPALFG